MTAKLRLFVSLINFAIGFGDRVFHKLIIGRRLIKCGHQRAFLRDCSQEGLKSTGGVGLFYCFAIN